MIVRLLALVGAILLPARAFAYQCTPVPGSLPAISQVWQSRCIPTWINPNSAMMSASGMRQLVAQSFLVWSENSCTDLEFLDAGTTDQSAGFDPARCDNKNIIAAIETDAELVDFFDSPDLLAVTLTSFSTATGEIFDADILFNNAPIGQFAFAEVSTTGVCEAQNPRPYDIRNTLIHEIGHFIGFDHVPNDPDATMFPSAVQCETSKRSLDVDDIAAVCQTYPKGLPTNTCAPPTSYAIGGDVTAFREQCLSIDVETCEGGGSCSCRATNDARSTSVGWLAIFAALIWRRRQR